MINTASFFGQSGPLANHLDNYEQRDAQLTLALAVEGVIEHKGVLLAEAGTGTGKTMAYLVPALFSQHTVVISTGTKNLQEQIYFKDLDLLSRALGSELNAVYLKGQENYLCLRRFEEFINSPRVLAHAPKQVNALIDWSRQTETGDRMEIGDLSDNDAIWREVCSTKDTRIGPRCRHASDCFVSRARRDALQAQIVIVNHHLYFADLATRLQGGSILPAHDVVIFDEAHTVEDVATEFFSLSISSSGVRRLLDDTLKLTQSRGLNDAPGEQRRPQLIDSALRASTRLFSKFRGPKGRKELIVDEVDTSTVEAYYKLDSDLDALEHSLKQLEGTDEIIEHCCERIKTTRDHLAQILTESVHGYVHWIDNREKSVAVGASPIDVSDHLRDGLFLSIPTVVLTSATLSTDGQFNFLKSRMGIDFDVAELSLDSPFDFERQACLHVPTTLCDPRDEAFVDEAQALITQLIDITDGNALILSTSIRNMLAFHERLVEAVPGRDIIVQGQAPKHTLLQQFKQSNGSVLCATASFWQGVDLPGDELRLVVIDKLPFDSPSDPLIRARIEHLRAAQQNPFKVYQIPQATLALKQGFGRLIRTRQDRGIVSILDTRLRTKSYAGAFLRSLPPCPVFGGMADVKEWWKKSAAPKIVVSSS